MNVMQTIGLCCALLISLPLWASTTDGVLLVPERRVSVHVGQTVVLQMPSERHYSVKAAGSALIPVKHSPQKGTAVYRAAHAGLETLILTPVGSKKGQCVSCVTRHYFVTVVP